MINEALEYFRGLENVVFALEYDNGESHEDNWTSINTVAYRSIDKLIEKEKSETEIMNVCKNEPYPGQEMQVGGLYTISFETDRNSNYVHRLRKKCDKMQDEISGSGKEMFQNLSTKEQEKKWGKLSDLQIKLMRCENDYSSTTVIVLTVE